MAPSHNLRIRLAFLLSGYEIRKGMGSALLQVRRGPESCPHPPSGHLIFRVLHKVKTQGLLLKNCLEFQSGNSRAFNAPQGPSERWALGDDPGCVPMKVALPPVQQVSVETLCGPGEPVVPRDVAGGEKRRASSLPQLWVTLSQHFLLLCVGIRQGLGTNSILREGWFQRI